MISRSRSSTCRNAPKTRGKAYHYPAGTIPRKAGLNGLDEVLITEMVSSRLQGAALHRLDSHRNLGVRCNENDRQFLFRGKRRSS